MHKLIDVSKYQPSIDYEKVKADGIEGAILRCGITYWGEQVMDKDPYFEQHYKGFQEAGLPVGAYYFSAAGQMGLSMPANTFFGLLVAIWFLLNELLSILENVGRAGTPLPGFLQKLIAALKHTVEGKGDEIVPEETSEEK